jgi:YidC/Oxa1 family membrane protein insertase
MSAFLGVPVDAAYHIVSVLTALLTPLAGGLAAAAAIAAFTMAVRLLLLPLSYRAMRGLNAQARLAPQVRALRKEHAGEPDRLQRELSALYQAEGTTMLAGCLPLLLQWPFLSVMYLLFRSPAIDGLPNTLLTHDLLGAPLGGHWLAGAGAFSAQGAVFAAIFAALAGLGWLSAREARRHARGATEPAASGTAASTTAASTTTASTTAGQAAGAAGAARVAARLAPYLTVVVAAFLPLAAGLYLLTTTAWTLAERTFLPMSR